MNEKFYGNKIIALPFLLTIKQLEEKWSDYSYRIFNLYSGLLEWLFPVNEQSICTFVKPLKPKEAARMANSLEISRRYIGFYEEFLKMFGVILDPQDFGRLSIQDENRLKQIISCEKYCRIEDICYMIKRVARSLGLLGFRSYKSHFLNLFKSQLSTEDAENIDWDLKDDTVLNKNSVFLIKKPIIKQTGYFRSYCFCKKRAVRRTVKSKTSPNYGRVYYCCGQKPHCNYFCFQRR